MSSSLRQTFCKVLTLFHFFEIIIELTFVFETAELEKKILKTTASFFKLNLISHPALICIKMTKYIELCSGNELIKNVWLLFLF